MISFAVAGFSITVDPYEQGVQEVKLQLIDRFSIYRPAIVSLDYGNDLIIEIVTGRLPSRVWPSRMIVNYETREIIGMDWAFGGELVERGSAPSSYYAGPNNECVHHYLKPVPHTITYDLESGKIVRECWPDRVTGPRLVNLRPPNTPLMPEPVDEFNTLAIVSYSGRVIYLPVAEAKMLVTQRLIWRDKELF